MKVLRLEMERFVIIGFCGAGKTTLGKVIADKLSLTHIDLDEFNWLPGWKMRPHEEFKNIITKKIEKPRWVVSGNYSNLHSIIWPKLDVVVWLDYPILVCFWRCFKRSIKRIITKEPCCNGNYATFRGDYFSRHSIFVWLFKSYKKRKQREENFERFRLDPKYQDAKFVRLKSQKETDKWVASLM